MLAVGGDGVFGEGAFFWVDRELGISGNGGGLCAFAAFAFAGKKYREKRISFR